MPVKAIAAVIRDHKQWEKTVRRVEKAFIGGSTVTLQLSLVIIINLIYSEKFIVKQVQQKLTHSTHSMFTVCTEKLNIRLTKFSDINGCSSSD